MTTDIMKLSDAVNRDTSDVILKQRIRERVEQIKSALRQGRDFEVRVGNSKVVIKSRKRA